MGGGKLRLGQGEEGEQPYTGERAGGLTRSRTHMKSSAPPRTRPLHELQPPAIGGVWVLTKHTAACASSSRWLVIGAALLRRRVGALMSATCVSSRAA